MSSGVRTYMNETGPDGVVRKVAQGVQIKKLPAAPYESEELMALKYGADKMVVDPVMTSARGTTFRVLWVRGQS